MTQPRLKRSPSGDLTIANTRIFRKLNKAYELYCVSDSFFFDTPANVAESEEFAATRRSPPDGWDRIEFSDWVECRPKSSQLPSQGWKVHVSATAENAEEVLNPVWDYCIRRSLTFKFIRNRPILLFRNAKAADRGASGKFVTIYPRDESELERVLGELGSDLEGQKGPHILSDLRWGRGPLYVRYGGFAARWIVASNGDLEPAIEDPLGNLVPDQRLPSFQLPGWVALPEFLEPSLAARDSATFDGIPYHIQGAIHFSNTGGVYRAVDARTGKHVVLKEARPFTSFSTDGMDAVTRLNHERLILERLSGLDVVPECRDYFTVGEHHYLVQDFVEGPTLNKELVRQLRLADPDTTRSDLTDYTNWATNMCRRVEHAVGLIHDRGVIIGDINASNVLVKDDGDIALVDWEAAVIADEGKQPTLSTPDFRIRRDLSGFDIDRHALALLRIYMFLPLTALVRFDVRKAAQLGAEIVKLFPVEPDFINEAVNVIAGADSASDTHLQDQLDGLLDGGPWPELRDTMVRSILSSATPDRDDRLFPGDPDQFGPGGGVNLANGAAGVLYALGAVNAGRYPEYEDWLVKHSLRQKDRCPLGLYDGLAGIAYVLDDLGRHDDAYRILRVCTDRIEEVFANPRIDLSSGLAGIGLVLDHFATASDDPRIKDITIAVTERAVDRLGDVDDAARVSGGDHPYAGLFRGSSGLALLFMRWFERTGDRAWLEKARTAIWQDLQRCVESPEGGLYVDEGWRLMPYIADGSAGIGMVIDQFLRHEADAALAEKATAIARVARSGFYVFPGLFLGRSGMILYLANANTGIGPAVDPAISEQVRHLSWHAFVHNGELTFPGSTLLRFSMDLATGTAGVLLALGAAMHDRAISLPLIGAASGMVSE